MKRSPEVQAFIEANAKKGGLSTRRKYGKAHYKKMGLLSAKARKALKNKKKLSPIDNRQVVE